MTSRTYVMNIINAKGLHARASTKFAEICEKYNAKCHVQFDGMRVDGRSIMGLMMLGAACGTSIEVEIAGDEAGDLARALEHLLANYFNEGG